jgi:7,8-dihydro-6-hydroxymethylpterin dimethyltransferase
MDRDYIFHELTRSICPSCRRVIDAKILLRDGKVYMSKRCPRCGPFMSLVYGDAEAYISFARFNKPGTIPRHHGAPIEHGCPHDCGLCPEHEQHACLGIIEVNSACDMDCPLCFADAAPGFSLTPEEVDEMLDDYVRAEGKPEVVQFSGGEPTMHPRIIDFIRSAQARDIRFVMVNTNGKRIARDDRFLEQLDEVRPALYFQFDGFERETYRKLRGEPDILEEKLTALDRLARIGLNVTIVSAIERGINEHEVGKIVEFAIEHPAIRGITFQPAFHAGRHPAHDPMRRMTIPDIVALIGAQTAGKFVASDFVPVPCCFPTCNAVTYAFVEDGRVTPLPRVINVDDYLDYITNRIVPDFSREIRTALEGLWSSSAVAGSETSLRQVAISCEACQLPDKLAISAIAQNMIMIMLQDFMDPWTFNQKNLMKCCKEFLLPGGKQVPFCAYNSVGYREQARRQLDAMEDERRRARREGRVYVPQPVVFDFSEETRVR